MKPEQLQQIVKEKNEHRERQMLRSAEELIESIVTEQQRIREAEGRIVEARKALKELQVVSLDAASILGAE